MFEGNLSENEALEKHKVSIRTYRRWLKCPEFVAEFDFRIDASGRQGRLIVARHVPQAAKRLVQLAGDDKGETARKACLDIMSLPFSDKGKIVSQGDDNAGVKIDTDLASKLLKTLAQDSE